MNFNIGLSQDFLNKLPKLQIPEVKLSDVQIQGVQIPGVQSSNQIDTKLENSVFSGLTKIGNPSQRRSSIANFGNFGSNFGNFLKPEPEKVVVNEKAMSELFDTMSHHERDVLKDVFERNAMMNANDQSRHGGSDHLGSTNSLKSGNWFTGLRGATEELRKNRSRRGSVFSVKSPDNVVSGNLRQNELKPPTGRNRQFSTSSQVLKPQLPVQRAERLNSRRGSFQRSDVSDMGNRKPQQLPLSYQVPDRRPIHSKSTSSNRNLNQNSNKYSQPNLHENSVQNTDQNPSRNFNKNPTKFDFKKQITSQLPQPIPYSLEIKRNIPKQRDYRWPGAEPTDGSITIDPKAANRIEMVPQSVHDKIARERSKFSKRTPDSLEPKNPTMRWLPHQTLDSGNQTDGDYFVERFGKDRIESEGGESEGGEGAASERWEQAGSETNGVVENDLNGDDFQQGNFQQGNFQQESYVFKSPENHQTEVENGITDYTESETTHSSSHINNLVKSGKPYTIKVRKSIQSENSVQRSISIIQHSP